ncbi:MAG: hypothetical protein H0W23_09525 [Chloroflexia bacterium]|jgi:hypothetical protein|nr:hypothetical protein [Chloroflexia bacterium]
MTIEGTDEYEWMVRGHWVIHRRTGSRRLAPVLRIDQYAAHVQEPCRRLIH